MSYKSIVLGDGPTHYYRLDDALRTSVVDLGSLALSGTQNGGITLEQRSLITDTDTCMLFDGSTGYVDTGASLSSLTALSIECWVKPSNLSYSGFPRFVANDTNASNVVHAILGSTPNGAGLFWNVGNGTTTAEADATFQLSTTTSSHVVGTWDGSTIKIYVNGSQMASTALSGAMATSTQTLDLARTRSTGSDYWPGYLDEVAIYNKALTSTQVLAHYNAGVAFVQILACWREQPFHLDELVNGEVWMNDGGLYRMQIEQITEGTAHEILYGFKWLQSTLEGDTTLASFAPGGVWRALAPTGASTPFVIVSLQSGHDVTNAFGVRIMADLTYQIKAVGPASSETNIVSAAERIDVLLGGTTSGPAAGQI